MTRAAAAPWAAGLALVAGAAAAFAHPPFGVLPGLAGYGLLLALLERAEPARPLRSAFWRGWLAGTAYFLVGCWWVAEAFLVDALEQGWMAPLAVVLLAGGLGLFWGAAGALYAGLKPVNPLWRALVFAGALSALEWLRGHVLTGFPWDLPGEAWAAGSAPSQAASVIGAYGLTWLTLAIVAALAAPPLFGRARPPQPGSARASALWAWAGFTALAWTGCRALKRPTRPRPWSASCRPTCPRPCWRTPPASRPSWIVTCG